MTLVEDTDKSIAELQQRIFDDAATKKAAIEAKRKEAEALNKPLTPKEHRFCQEYVKDCNGCYKRQNSHYTL